MRKFSALTRKKETSYIFGAIRKCSPILKFSNNAAKKAYDSVRREVLYNILIVRPIKMCLSETYTKVI
jgi:hypothetical protein